MAAITGTSGSDSLTGTSSSDTIDALGGNDEIHGEGGADTVIGGTGDDSVGGGAGNDWLEGGLGHDTLGGSGDRDHFVFREAGTANADIVVDMSSNWDDIQLDVAAFTALGATGRFVAGDARFFAGAGATSGHDADDRIVFNTTTHQLFYDADGNGAGSAQLIATLSNGANITATDITAFGAAVPSGSTINGTAGDDTLTGTSENETIDGLGGNDSINGGGGADALIGSAGNDYLFGGDALNDGTGADPADHFFGGDGNDTLDGLNSPRFAETDPDVDTMDGGLGNDLFLVDNAGDVLTDSGGIDTVSTHNVAWTLGAGFDNLIISNGETEVTDTFTGNALANVMDGSQGGWNFNFQGLDGDDTLIGGGRNNTLVGGNGNDVLNTGFATRTDLTGGAGADDFAIRGQFIEVTVRDFLSGTDEIHLDARAMAELGASGRFSANDPRFFAAAGATAGHDADDRVIFDTSTGVLHYDPDGNGAASATDLARLNAAPVASDIAVDNGAPPSGGGGGGATEGNDTLVGTAGDDSIDGLGGNDSISGLGGNDTLDGGAAVDTLDGGAGNDTYFVTTGDVLADASGADTVVSNAPYWLLGSAFENLTLNGTAGTDGDGNALANLMTGNSGANEFHGNGGADTIVGSSGNDSIGGGSGNDWLEGGMGNDTLGGSGDRDHFVFREFGAANADTVLDMNRNWDDVRFDAAAFTDLGATGRFTSGDARFFSGAGATAAHDASDRIVYNTSTGNLYYDHDGSGGDAPQLVATLQGAPAILATDIWSFS